MSNRDPNDTVGITRLFAELRVNPRTLNVESVARDMIRGFTTLSFDLGATANVLYTLIGAGGGATIHASAQGVCFGIMLVNNTGATGGTVTIWEGTASTRKIISFLPAGDVQPLGNYPGGDHENPLFKWQPGRTLQARSSVNGFVGCISVNMCYWAEEP